MKRRGFTLVEGLVAATLLALSLALIMRCVSEARQREARVDARLDALRGITLALSHLGHDFGQVVPIRGFGLKAKKDSGGVVFFRSPRTLAAADMPAVAADLTPVWQRVTYRYDAERHQLLRDGKALGSYRGVRLAFDPAAKEGYTLEVEVDARVRLAFHSPQGTRAIVHQESMP
jgi:type II secretory pathway pseudopilin PulG